MTAPFIAGLVFGIVFALAFKVRGELRDLQRDGIISGPRSRSLWGRWKRRRLRA